MMTLRERCHRLGLTLSELSEQSGVGRSRLGDLFLGKTSCTVTDFERLCDVIEERPSRVLEEAETYLEATSSYISPDLVLLTWKLARLPEEPLDLVLDDIERELEWADGDEAQAAKGLRKRWLTRLEVECHQDRGQGAVTVSREAERERLLAGLAAGVPVESLGLAAKRDGSWAREAAERSGWREDLGEEPQAGPAEEG